MLLKWLRNEGIFGWNYLHLIKYPWILLEEGYYHIKWFFQRGWRGWDDRATWSIDGWLSPKIIPLLECLRKRKVGHPVGETRRSWDRILIQIIDGFKADLEIQHWDHVTIKELKRLQRHQQNGLHLFAKHYNSLWD